MALTKITGQVINDTTGLVVGVTTVGGGISATDGFFSGIVTAVGDASFSGNVSVGGTLTYEDVTNIDAVGLVTARNGVVVGSGITLSKDGDVFFTGIATGNGSGLTALNASNLASGTVPTARLGSGTASSSTFLRGDSTFAAVTSTTINSNADNRVITGSDTANTLNGEANLSFDGSDLTITNSGASNKGIKMTATGNYYPSIVFDANRGAENNAIVYIRGSWNGTEVGALSVEAGDDTTNKDDGKVTFYTAQGGTMTRKMAIEQDGNVHIDTGNVVIGTAGKGIDFSAQSGAASGMSSELLDHYEEGSWTPIMSFGYTSTGITYSVQKGYYQRIGNRVHANCYLMLTSKGSSTGTARVGGLPFTIKNETGFYQTASLWATNITFGNTVPTGYGELNSTSFRIDRQNASSSSGVYGSDHTNFNNSTELMLSFHYQVE